MTKVRQILDKNGQTLLDAATPKHHCEIVRGLVVSCHEDLGFVFVVCGRGSLSLNSGNPLSEQ